MIIMIVNLKREKARFQHLVDTFKNIPNLTHQAHCLALINALISTPNNQITRAQIYREFLSLGVLETVRVIALKQLHLKSVGNREIFG